MNSLELVKQAIHQNNYKIALNNLSSIKMKKNNPKYMYLEDLERYIKHLFSMYLHGASSTDIEKTVQYADSCVDMLEY